MKLGKAIKNLRKKRGMNQRSFALLAGVSQPYISFIEQDKKKPSQDMLGRLATALNVPVPLIVWEAMDEEDVPENKKKVFFKMKKIMDELISVYFDE